MQQHRKLHERIESIYEDLDVIVIEKANGILSYPIEGVREEDAIRLIRRYWKAIGSTEQHLYLLHRLDKETSGLMVFAKTSRARDSLRRQFENHSVVRSYIAQTSGIPSRSRGEIHAFLGRDLKGRRAVANQGRESVTRYQVLRSNPAKNTALIRCFLQTGRTHQVRIHLAHIGTPVMGDTVYGKSPANRMLLHAEALGFIHPRSEMPIVFRSSLPWITDL